MNAATDPNEAWSEERATAIIAAHAGREGATLPILHALQAAFGYVPKQAVPLIADALNLTRAEVHGVVTFYHDFRRAPAGPARAQAVPRGSLPGGRRATALAAHAQRAARHRLARDHRRTARVTLEPVYCLGLCAIGPAGDARRRSRSAG